ncbi:RapZ C-terminal domain-containing protein [Streptomyces sp. NPDC055036]
MTYETDLAAAKRARRAWTCSCGADNPPTYDSCHDCQRPSWTCAGCGTVNATVWSHCQECDNTIPGESLGDREEGFEMTYAEFVAARCVGPRRVGGRYDHGYADSEYEVLAIDRGPREGWPSWQITVRGKDGRVREHCTSWDSGRDRIVAQAPADVTIVSVGRLHDEDEGEWADVLQRATIALDLRRHFRDPHVRADLRQLTAHAQVVRDTVMNTPGVRQVLAATALQIQGYLSGPTAAPVTVVTQCAGGRHRAATTAMALRAVVAGDVEQAAAYGLADAAKEFATRRLSVDLVHRDLDKDVVER